MAKWDGERSLPKLQIRNSEIQQNILEDTKTFDNIEERRQLTSPISLDNFLSDSTMNIKTDGNDIKDTKKPCTVQDHIDHIDQSIPETSEIVTNKHIVCEKQELEEKPSQALPTITASSVIKRKITEYENYEEEKFNNGNRARAVTTAHEIPVIVEQSQTSATNVNILQLQSIYCGSSLAQDNSVFTDVMQNSRDIRKVNDQ